MGDGFLQKDKNGDQKDGESCVKSRLFRNQRSFQAKPWRIYHGCQEEIDHKFHLSFFSGWSWPANESLIKWALGGIDLRLEAWV